MDFETRAIHEGQEPDPTTGAVIVPIYQTSTFAQEAVGEHKGYDYSRSGNPTRRALEVCLASLESAEYGFAFSSGMGATTTIMHLVSPGERIVAVNDVYGGTYRLFDKVYAPKGYDFAYAPAAELAGAIDERTPYPPDVVRHASPASIAPWSSRRARSTQARSRTRRRGR